MLPSSAGVSTASTWNRLQRRQVTSHSPESQALPLWLLSALFLRCDKIKLVLQMQLKKVAPTAESASLRRAPPSTRQWPASPRFATGDDPEARGGERPSTLIYRQVLFERTGSGERLFEPIPADEIRGLRSLHEELDFADKASQDMAPSGHTCGFLCSWMHKLGFGLYRCQENRTS
jgi:hypothetical protein